MIKKQPDMEATLKGHVFKLANNGLDTSDHACRTDRNGQAVVAGRCKERDRD